jgi:hypothetical protein
MSLDPLVIKDSSLKTWFKVWEAREGDRPGDTDCDIEPKPGEANVWDKVSYQQGIRQFALVFGKIDGLKKDTLYCVRAYAENAGGPMEGEWEPFTTTYESPVIDVDFFKTENIISSKDPKKKNNFSYKVTGKVLSEGGVRGDGVNITVYWWLEGELPTNVVDPTKTEFFKDSKNPHRIEYSTMRLLSGENFEIMIGHDNLVLGKKYYYAVIGDSLGTQGFKKTPYIFRSFASNGPEMKSLDIYTMAWGKNLLRGIVKSLGSGNNYNYYFRVCSFAPRSGDAGTKQDKDFACQEFDAQAKEVFTLPESNKSVFYWNLEVPEMRQYRENLKSGYFKDLDPYDQESLRRLPQNIGRYGYEAQACVRSDCLNNGKYDCRSCTPIQGFISMSDTPFYSQKHGEYTTCLRKGSDMNVWNYGCGDSVLSMVLAYWYHNDANFRNNWRRAYTSIESCAEPMGCDDNHIKGVNKDGQTVPLAEIPDKDLSADDIYRKYLPTTYKVLRYLTCRGLFSGDWVMDGDKDSTKNSVEKELRRLGLQWLPITGTVDLNKKYPWYPKSESVNWKKTHMFTRIGIPLLLRCDSTAKTGTHYVELIRWETMYSKPGYVKAILNDSGYGQACATGLMLGGMEVKSNGELGRGCGTSGSENRGDQNYAVFPLHMMSQVEEFYDFAKPGFKPGFD